MTPMGHPKRQTQKEWDEWQEEEKNLQRVAVLRRLIKFTGYESFDIDQLKSISSELLEIQPPTQMSQRDKDGFIFEYYQHQLKSQEGVALYGPSQRIIPRYKWSKATPEAFGFTYFPPTFVFEVMQFIKELEVSKIVESGDWVSEPDCSNRLALAYLRHYKTTKDLVWSKDAYKTSYFMISLSKVIGTTALPAHLQGHTFLSTSKLIIRQKDQQTVEVMAKLKSIIKRLKMTEGSSVFIGDDFIKAIDNTATARKPLLSVKSKLKSHRLIMEMKINPDKKTIFFAPIGVAMVG